MYNKRSKTFDPNIKIHNRLMREVSDSNKFYHEAIKTSVTNFLEHPTRPTIEELRAFVV